MAAPHPTHDRPGRASHRLQPVPAIAALMLVLAAHALLLGALPQGQPPEAPAGMPQRLPALQTRQIVEAPALTTPAPRAMPMSTPAAAVKPIPTPARLVAAPARPATVARHDDTAPPAIAEPVVLAAAAASAPATAPATAPVTAGTPAPPSPATETAEVPIFRTRLPPAARLQYELRRGMLRGSGHLFWQPGAETYELTLEGSALGMVLIGWDSRGGFDAAGIAPLRYLDSRRGRDAQAANFRRDSGRITFSGPAIELPLPPGAQDRLSWMLQLPAIVDADPGRFAPGAHIPMWVVGARGEMAVWSFAVEAREAISVPAGPVSAALRLRREPRKPYDTLVEVWLDPERHHLPVKIRLSIPQTGDSTEFMLQDLHWP